MKSNAPALDRELKKKPQSQPEVPNGDSTKPDGLIAPLAYRYWQERGCQEGCPEEDWFRAEREIEAQTQK